MIDLYHSRRNFHIKCEYYKASKDAPLNELAHDRKPDGVFYARRESGQYSANSQANNIFQFEVSTVTLRTPDRVDLEPNDMVRFDGRAWIVQNSQRIYKTDNEYKKDPEATVIYLRKGRE